MLSSLAISSLLYLSYEPSSLLFFFFKQIVVLAPEVETFAAWRRLFSCVWKCWKVYRSMFWFYLVNSIQL
jgi:hypothetical protein